LAPLLIDAELKFLRLNIRSLLRRVSADDPAYNVADE
jgi:hypothetical protein